jgi:hypothetical protein
MFLTTTFIVIMIYVHHHHVFVMNTVYERWSLLGEIPRPPVIKLTRKTSAILFNTDISILDITSIIYHLKVNTQVS